MKTVVHKGAEFESYLGSDIRESIVEVFDWYFSGEGKNCDTCTIRHLNGVKVTFEREETP